MKADERNGSAGGALFATVPEVARATLMRPSFIYEKISQGKIAVRRFGKALRIPRKEFERLINEGLPED